MLGGGDRPRQLIFSIAHLDDTQRMFFVALLLVEILNWTRKQPGTSGLRALVYFVAYTGCRFAEAVHLEWKDVAFDKGIAFLYFKIENDLKTEGSQAPFGLPSRLIDVLREWGKDRTCSWVFPNERRKPWKAGGKQYRPFDQLRALASIGHRAGTRGASRTS